MTDPRWRMVPYPSFIINDVFMTSLLLLKNFKALTNSMILSETFQFIKKYFHLMGKNL